MHFSKDLIDEIEIKYNECLSLLGEKRQEYTDALLALNDEEIIYLKFIYSSLTISDIANTAADVFVEDVVYALKARDALSWGSTIDEKTFLEYVVFPRINHEHIERYRKDFFSELYPRVCNLSIYEAALEVNYWCLEKATYHSTDIRTSSPNNVIRSAYGRCGEESTLYTAALRSVCIPAKQIYVPRWSHSDDNHAWTEILIDGKWQFVGACEPEMKLNSGWFIGPASRSLYIKNRLFTSLNNNSENTKTINKRVKDVCVLEHYLKTQKINVCVLKNGQALIGAKVSLQVINYSELFTLFSDITDKNGRVVFNTSHSDAIIEVVYNDKIFIQKAQLVKTSEYLFDIDNAQETDLKQISLSPLAATENPSMEKIDDSLLKKHLERCERCNKIRQETESTFYDYEKALVFSKMFERDNEKIANFLVLARGNFKEIEKIFTDKNISLIDKVKTLSCLSEKDFTDLIADDILEHITYSNNFDKVSLDVFYSYIVNPRIFYEHLSSYKKYFLKFFTNDEIENFCKNPLEIFQYIKNNVALLPEYEHEGLFSQPVGTLTTKCSTEISSKILFVAIARSVGIPARINTQDLSIEYYKNDWVKINFENSSIAYSSFMLTINSDTDLFTHKNITIAHKHDGCYLTLSIDDYAKAIPLKVGQYRIIASSRNSKGIISANIYYVDLKCNTIIQVKVPQIIEKVSRTLSLSSDFSLFYDTEFSNKTVVTKDKKILIWCEINKEPTEHVINEIIENSDYINERNIPLYFIFNNNDYLSNNSCQKMFEQLSQYTCCYDKEYFQADILFSELQINKIIYPLMCIINKNNDVVHAVNGYNVGAVETVINIFNKI